MYFGPLNMLAFPQTTSLHLWKNAGQSLLFLTFLILSQPVGAQNFKVTVGFSHFPPWQVAKDNHWIGGLDKQILEKLAETLVTKHAIHLEIIPKKCPLKRCLRELEVGAIDMKTGLLKQKSREAYLTFIEPPYQPHTNKVIYYDPSRMNDIARISDLYGYRIGLARGAKTFPEFDLDTKIRKILTNGTSNGLKLVCANRLDAFIGTELVMDYVFSNQKYCSHLRKSSLSYKSQVPGYFAISKQSPLMTILPQLNDAMADLVKSGEITRLVNGFKNY
jgi:polar amino acid transport system substrate-binding protein